MLEVYIISAIQNALRQGNLNPEIEEKLLNLQRCHEKRMKGTQRTTSFVLANNHHEYSSHIKSSASRKNPTNRQMDDDDDWMMEIPKRKLQRTNVSEKKTLHNFHENDVNRIIQSVAEETSSSSEVVRQAVRINTQTIKTKSVNTTEKPEEGTSIKESNNEKSRTDENFTRIMIAKKESEKRKQMQVI